MKIITNNAAYVQKNDICFLTHCEMPIPASIFMKVFSDKILIVDDRNRYDFIKFDLPEEIEFFKKIDWMIDYDEVRDLSEEKIIALGQSIANEKNIIAQKYNAMSPSQKEKNGQMVSRYEFLDFKLYSLSDIFLLKKGRLKMKFPDEIELPVEFKTECGVKKLIKNMFNKNKFLVIW